MAFIPNEAANQNTVNIKVPVPEPVVQKPKEEQQQTRPQAKYNFKSDYSQPQSLILPYNPPQSVAQQFDRAYEGLIQYAAKKRIKKLKSKVKNYIVKNPGLVDGNTGASICYSKDYYGEPLTSYPEVKSFHQNMTDNPHDSLPHLVYVDWLEEHGMPAHAKMIRGHIDKVTSGQTKQLPTEVEHFTPSNTPSYATNIGNTILSLYLKNHNNDHSFYYSMRDLNPSHLEELAEQLQNEGVELSPDLQTKVHLRNTENKHNYEKTRAPAGGIVKRGLYYSGGKFLPDTPNSSNLPKNEPQQLSQPKQELTKEDKWQNLLNKTKKIWKLRKKTKVIDKLQRNKDSLIKYAADMDKQQIDNKYRGPSYQPRKDENWYDEDWKHVTSSNVNSVAYNPDFHRLYIEFKRRKGGHAVYQYENVPPNMHENLMNAASKGKFVYYVLRNNGTDSEFAYKQID